MKTNSRRIQLVLLSIGLLLFVLTYLYYPYFNKNKYFEKPTVKKDFKKTIGADQITNFENIEYKGLYDFDKPFIVHAEEAYIKTNEDPDVVWMKNMRVVLYLSDERIVTITSDSGHYNKLTYDCYFENNVLATDGETQISGSNLNLLATENVAKIYNDVNLNHPMGNLQADEIYYNFLSKHFTVKMFDDKSVKMKVIQ